MPNYSNKSLVDKLGIKYYDRVYFGNAPTNYSETLGRLPPKVTVSKRFSGRYDFIQYFFTKSSDLEIIFPKLKKKS